MSLRCECSDCRVIEIDRHSAELKVWMAGHWRVESGQFIQVCPPAAAHGAMELRNRGLAVTHEITVWPKPKAHLLTTGAKNNALMSVKTRDSYGHIAAVLGMGAWRVPEWMDEWRKEARRLARVREELRNTKASIEKRSGGWWIVRGRTREGVYTSAARKFRAWEQAVQFVTNMERAEKAAKGD